MSQQKEDVTPILDDVGEPELRPTVTYVRNRTSYLTIAVLVVINLINYMDRYTVAGVLHDVQTYYGLHSSQDGLIQTVFVLVYMVFSPLFGYLGDRYTRKYIISAGIVFWSGVTLAGSFMDKHHFWAFLVFRALVGVGEASYATVAPTIIADLFHKDQRTKTLMIFNAAVPCGSGLGYIVGSNVAKLFGEWQWALRITPAFGVLCAMVVLVLPEPRRGLAEGSEGKKLKNTAFFQDLKTLFKNKSFILSSLGFTCVAFVTGTLALWAPIFMYDSIKYQGHEAEQPQVGLIFGIITVIAGLSGVAIGGETARRYRKINPRADPLVCAAGLLLAAPFIFLAMYLSQWYTILSWVLIFIGETLVCLNWSVVNDILLYVVVPTRRAIAAAVQILMCHALGDAGSPYLVGLISDALAKNYKDPATTPSVQFLTLRSALYITPFVSVLGGAFFLANALYVEQDREHARLEAKIMFKKESAEHDEEQTTDSGIADPSYTVN